MAAVLAAYLPALEAGFVWNDDTYLTENRTLDTLDGLGLIWTEPKANEQYYPMVFTSFWIEKHLWSLHPFGYHLVNVLLHAGSALLLWWLLVRLSLPGAWLAAAVFPLASGVRRIRRVGHRAQEHALAVPVASRCARLVCLSRSPRESRARAVRFERAGRRGFAPVGEVRGAGNLRLAEDRAVAERAGTSRISGLSHGPRRSV